MRYEEEKERHVQSDPCLLPESGLKASQQEQQQRQPLSERNPAPASNDKVRLVHWALHVSCGAPARPGALRNTYLVVRAPWLQQAASSVTCWAEEEPQYDYTLISPVLLTAPLVARLHNNLLVVEVWQRSHSPGQDRLVGLCRVPLERLYLTFSQPDVTETVLQMKSPVMAYEGRATVTHPATGATPAHLQLTLAAGTHQQVEQWGAPPRQRRQRSKQAAPPPSSSCIIKLSLDRLLHVPEINEAKSGEVDCFVQYTWPTQADSGELRLRSFTTEPAISHAGVRCDVVVRSFYPVVRDRVIARGVLSSSQIFGLVEGSQTELESGASSRDGQSPPISQEGAAGDAEEGRDSDSQPTSESEMLQRLRKPLGAPAATGRDRQAEDRSDILTSIERDLERLRKTGSIFGRRQQSAYRSVPLTEKAAFPAPHEQQVLYVRTERTAGSSAASPNTSGTGVSSRPSVEALHLPRIVRGERRELPRVFVSAQTAGGVVSSPLKTGTRPRWNWSRTVWVGRDLLQQEFHYLVLKVWHRGGAGRDRVLGLVLIDLVPLLHGLDELLGWYNIVDLAGVCRGQMKLSLRPLDDVPCVERDSLDLSVTLDDPERTSYVTSSRHSSFPSHLTRYPEVLIRAVTRASHDRDTPLELSPRVETEAVSSGDANHLNLPRPPTGGGSGASPECLLQMLPSADECELMNGTRSFLTSVLRKNLEDLDSLKAAMMRRIEPERADCQTSVQSHAVQSSPSPADRTQCSGSSRQERPRHGPSGEGHARGREARDALTGGRERVDSRTYTSLTDSVTGNGSWEPTVATAAGRSGKHSFTDRTPREQRSDDPASDLVYVRAMNDVSSGNYASGVFCHRREVRGGPTAGPEVAAAGSRLFSDSEASELRAVETPAPAATSDDSDSLPFDENLRSLNNTSDSEMAGRATSNAELFISILQEMERGEGAGSESESEYEYEYEHEYEYEYESEPGSESESVSEP
ncbi:C2 domain-containing protein 3-like [Pollicipes pollicipes]|uniref:C2 domain-containing protein 3-like n=1 Tax=Pollicipes pollicipes TaxID=41117 RepID=UPI001884FFB7|nr:C2 domain-containing protein 3-like [Pollicipes pollicipes]